MSNRKTSGKHPPNASSGTNEASNGPSFSSMDDPSLWLEVLDASDAAASKSDLDSENVGFARFELNIEKALARQLGPFMDQLDALPLTLDNVSTIPRGAKGAYYLLLDDEIVYIGKSNAELGLHIRLTRHYKVLSGRKYTGLEGISFKAAQIVSFAPLDTEKLLLDLYRFRSERLKRPKVQHSPELNRSGFGSNDTGIERDTQSVSRFDQKYPIDLGARVDLCPTFLALPDMTLAKYLSLLKEELQLTIRWEKEIDGKKQLTNSISVSELAKGPTLQDLILAISKELPVDWVLTVLRGKIVLYPHDEKAYKSPVWQLRSGQPTTPSPDYTLRDIGGKKKRANDADVQGIDSSKPQSRPSTTGREHTDHQSPT